MTDINDRIANLSPEQRAILEESLMAELASLHAVSGIPRRETKSSCRPSFGQERLWFLEQFEPNTPLYNVNVALLMRGGLNVAALQTALETIVQRHEALRTNLVSHNGKPTQVIHDKHPCEMAIREVAATWDEDREAVQRLLKEEARKPFDLAEDSLFRASLFCLGEDEHVLLITMHHIICDGWSVSVLLRELEALYTAYCAAKPASLPELPVQYADFALWQRNWLQGEVLEEQLAYWRKQLSGELPVLDLATDRSRPALHTIRGAHQYLQLPQELGEKLKTLSHAEGVTLFMTLLATFAALLHRYGGGEEIIVGSVIAGRNRSEIENLIGFFINTLPLRIDLTGEPSFRELLARTRNVALGAYAHQEMPFEKLVAELQPQRSPSRPAFFQAMFVLQNYPGHAMNLPGLHIEQFEVTTDTAKLDLSFEIVDKPGSLECDLEYNTDLFDAETIARMFGHFSTLLEGIVADVDQRICEVPLLQEAERQRLLVEWNNTGTDYPRDKCVHQLFEEQARRGPDAVALLCGDEQLTYRELNERANQLAHRLQAYGIAPDVAVGLCLERSVEMIIGILAILKAGGAYVPMDPDYPRERLAVMLEDTAAPVVLTERKLAENLPIGQRHILCLDDWADFAAESVQDPVSGTTAQNLAYVMYTSGSTGIPKGISIPHQAISRLVFNTNYIDLHPSDCIAQAANACFDTATFELWGALLHGARLVHLPRELILSPDDFAGQIRDQQISVMFLTTALFNLMAREAPSAFSTVRHLLFGGELVDPDAVQIVLENGPPDRLLHMYGPTESTTFATWYLVEDLVENASTVPIGQPISNGTVYILDSKLQPVPVGVPGELYIGGDGLARGYLNDPQLTSEKLIPSPFSSDPGGRLYRTGDLARYRPDGNIEFIGRIDFQVKIRGFRIELGEVEAVLGNHPAVRDVVVMAREDIPGDRRLVAYVVPDSEQSVSARELGTFLRNKLPEYMVPSAFVVLEVLPLTPNGKVDRRALPPPQVQPSSEGRCVAPKDERERQLQQIWQDALGTGRIGTTDNFFDLGGHSLLAARVFAEIEKILGRKLPLSVLFQAPTIEQLARVLQGEGLGIPRTSLVPIQPDGTRLPLFCAHPLFGDVFCYAHLAQHLGPDQPVYGFRAQVLDGEDMPDNVEQMAALYVAELKLVQPVGPYCLAGYSAGGSIAYEMAQQLCGGGDEVRLLAIIDHPAPRSGYRDVRRLLKPRFAYHFLREFPLGLIYHAYRIPQEPDGEADEQLTVRLVARRRASAIIRDAVRAYVPRPYDGRMTLFRSRRQRTVSSHDPEMGWQNLARGGLEVVVVPGDHNRVLHEPFVATLARKLRVCLEEAQASEGAGPQEASLEDDE